ncbi:hypothetical protein [Nocardia beijingensis]|uniref:hypothetical protein n=1 Tax=Nocardia beijingensis TaxID=95162 RepID=UPI00082CF403|nr:hypothetical protein [Nocardia beijingensis]
MAGTRPAHDDYERHYAEKIWALVPEIHRHEDGIAETPGQLRALVEILAEQAAIERRSIDRIVADSRIDEADDWAVAYIGQLLGTRLLHPLNSAGRRADVGHTLAYRRRAGTPRLLETLAEEVADWDAVAQEAFQHLFRYPHALDRVFPTGPVTHTPRGGFPDLRRARISDVLGGPFEDVAYRPEFRPGRSTRGRYNVPTVNLFCYRKYAFPLADVTPFRLDATHYTIDPSGRGHVPLFQQGDLTREDCVKPREWDVRMPITCRRLNTVLYRLPVWAATVGPGWGTMVGRTFESEDDLLAAATADGAGNPTGLLAAALVADSPKARLLAAVDAAGPAISLAIGTRAPLPPYAVVGAGLSAWAGGVTVSADVEALVDPARGLVELTAAPGGNELEVRRVHYGILYPVGAGTHDRSDRVPDTGPPPLGTTSPVLSAVTGDRVFGDSRTYTPTTGGSRIDVTAAARLWAADRERPFVLLRPAPDEAAIEIRALVAGASLELSGLWLGALLRGTATGGSLCELRLTGSFDQVVLRDVTLDPGGTQAALVGNTPGVIPHVRLVVAGQVEELVLDRCILGSIHEAVGSTESSVACTAARITLVDSILLPHDADAVLSLPGAELRMDRCTVLGDCRIGRADINNSIINGTLEVQDAQNSCLRFSMVRSGGRTPSQYECVVLPTGLPKGSFESVRFGDAGLGVLTGLCPKSVREGGEGGTEMGVYNRALVPIKLADLTAKVAEFAPIQAVIQLIAQT